MAQFARPDADQATGSWTTTPLWSKVEEGATGDDVTIASDDNTSPDDADLRLSDVTDPAVSTGHIIRVQWNKNASGGHTIDAVAELWQGVPDIGTLRATLTVTNIGNTPQTDTYTLTGTEADNITDYTDLFLRLSRQGDNGGPPGNRRSLVVDFVELEVPDAGATTVNGSAVIAGSGAATGVGLLTHMVSVSMDGAGAATGVGLLTHMVSVSMDGSGAVAGDAHVRQQAAAVIPGVATLTASPIVRQQAVASLDGSGTLAGVGLLTHMVSVSMDGSGAATGVGLLTHMVSVSMDGAGTLAGDAHVAGAGDAGSANLTKRLTDGLIQPSADALEDYMFD